MKTTPRRMLTQEDLAWIEELTLQIGPAFKAAIEKGKHHPNTRQSMKKGTKALSPGPSFSWLPNKGESAN